MIREFLIKKSLVIIMEEGADENGKPIMKRYTYTNIKRNATPENLHATATALSTLLQGEKYEFNTVDTNDVF